jgi:GH35 family endo-1,4-beta-xylanase
MNFRNTLLSTFAVLCSASLQAQETPLDKSLTDLNPVEIFSSNEEETYQFLDNRPNVKKSTLEVTPGKQGNKIYTAEIFQAVGSHYGVGLRWKTHRAMKKGDVMLARITLRTVYAKQESQESALYFYLQSPKEEKSFISVLATGTEWKTYDIPFTLKHDLKAGEGMVGLSLGALPQKVELTDVRILDFGNKTTVAQLPETRFTYAGREANAPWRKEALKRIEEVRVSPLRIKVVDSAGKPVRGAEVKADLVQSEFVWGTAVNEALLDDARPGSATYKAILKEFFNTAVIENGLKSHPWYSKRRPQTIRAFNWLEANGFRQRGHNLVWPGFKFNHAFMKGLAESDSVAFDWIIKKQVREKAAFAKGRVIAWDVINEMMHETNFFPYLPKDVAVQWFKLAREIDPDAQLFINEYSMLNGAESPRNIRKYLDLIADLRAQGAPIDAIGIQGHVGRQPRAPQGVLSDIDLVATSGLPLQITEFDINTPDEALQADYTRDFLIACYSHPEVTGVNLWGFWQGAHWKPDAGMFRMDWSPKPAAEWRKLVTGAWKTSLVKKSNGKGEVQTRGHRGMYDVTVSYKGAQKRVRYQLTKEGKELVIEL